MRKRKQEEASGGTPAWMATYSDLVTLLFAFFVLLFAMSKPDVNKLIQISSAFGQNVSLIDWAVGDSILENMSNGIMDMPPITQEGKDGDKDQNDESTSEAQEEFPDMGEDFPTYWAENAALEDVFVEATEHSIHFRLGDMLFDSGRADIKTEALDVLAEIAGEFDKYPDYDVVIEGHTDNVPINTARFPSNWALSSGRAESVGRFFIEDCGIDPVRITAVGYGEYRPIDTNDTAEGKANNRRVEIRLVRNVNEADIIN